jgi:hypothetical protein
MVRESRRTNLPYAIFQGTPVAASLTIATRITVNRSGASSGTGCRIAGSAPSRRRSSASSASTTLPRAFCPAAYFDWLRGRTHRLAEVFEHNRLDVLSLAALAGYQGRRSPCRKWRGERWSGWGGGRHRQFQPRGHEGRLGRDRPSAAPERPVQHCLRRDLSLDPPPRRCRDRQLDPRRPGDRQRKSIDTTSVIMADGSQVHAALDSPATSALTDSRSHGTPRCIAWRCHGKIRFALHTFVPNS